MIQLNENVSMLLGLQYSAHFSKALSALYERTIALKNGYEISQMLLEKSPDGVFSYRKWSLAPFIAWKSSIKPPKHYQYYQSLGRTHVDRPSSTGDSVGLPSSGTESRSDTTDMITTTRTMDLIQSSGLPVMCCTENNNPGTNKTPTRTKLLAEQAHIVFYW